MHFLLIGFFFQATESLVSSYVAEGVLPAIPHGDVLLFASVSALVMGLYKSGERQTTANKTEVLDTTAKIESYTGIFSGRECTRMSVSLVSTQIIRQIIRVGVSKAEPQNEKVQSLAA